jgi:hypothetical protein
VIEPNTLSSLRTPPSFLYEVFYGSGQSLIFGLYHLLVLLGGNQISNPWGAPLVATLLRSEHQEASGTQFFGAGKMCSLWHQSSMARKADAAGAASKGCEQERQPHRELVAAGVKTTNQSVTGSKPVGRTTKTLTQSRFAALGFALSWNGKNHATYSR